MTEEQHNALKAKSLNTQKRLYEDRRTQIFDHYGWACSCCGVDIPEFLCLDHIEGGGNKHREELTGRKNGGGSTMKTYKWVIDSGFPDSFRTLCHNCNHATRYGAPCPHEMERGDAL